MLDWFDFIGSMPSARQTVASRSGTDTGVFDGLPPALVADHLTSLDATTTQHRGPGAGEMVAAFVPIDGRRAAELAHPHDERAVEQTALLRSPMSVAQPASRTWLRSRTVSKLFLCVSQLMRLSPRSDTSMKGTPRSTRRRAKRQPWPNRLRP